MLMNKSNNFVPLECPVYFIEQSATFLSPRSPLSLSHLMLLTIAAMTSTGRLRHAQHVLRRSQVLSMAGGPRIRWFSVARAEPVFFPDEPTRPVVDTDFPGPKSRQALSEINGVFDTNNVNMVTDFGKSIGN